MRTLFFTLLLCLANITQALSFTQEISESDLQKKLDAMMPLIKQMYFITVEITSPKIELKDSENTLQMQANIAMRAPGNHQGSGKTTIAGTLSYNKKEGSFYFNQPTIIDLHVNNVADAYQPQIKQVTQIALSNAMQAFPVYTLKDDNVKHKLAKSTLDSVKVKNGKLAVTFTL